MSISREEVVHVAHLAHIGLTDADIDRMTHELSSVVEHVAKLAELDTDDVQPTGHAVDVQNVMREDEVRPSWPPELVLANAPVRRADFFEVPPVLES